MGKKLCDYCAKTMANACDGYLVAPEYQRCDLCGNERGFFYVYGYLTKKQKKANGAVLPPKLKVRYADKGNICHYCNEDMSTKLYRRTIDHKIPKSKGGGGGANILIACRDCNSAKGDMDYDKFIERNKITKRSNHDPR
jgi:5-methylcytosine-specific restriction endonuclease McrA